MQTDAFRRDSCILIVNFINILRATFASIFFCKKIQSQNVSREKLRKALTYKKFVCKMLITLTPEVDFTKLFSPSHWHATFDKKYCCAISPTIKTPNFKLKLANFLLNLFTVCKMFVRKNAATYFDEIDPRVFFDRISLKPVSKLRLCSLTGSVINKNYLGRGTVLP